MLFLKKLKKKLKLSRRIYTSNYQKQCKFLTENYLAVVVGSDEVLTAGKSRMMPFPNIYWPNESVTIPKFTYAGSANRANYSRLSIEDQAITLDIFQNYTYIGVRDYYSQNQVLSLDENLKTNINCDPTFLLDFNVELVKKLRPKAKVMVYNIPFRFNTKNQKKHSDFDKLYPILNVVDFFSPSLYLHYNEKQRKSEFLVPI